MILPGSKQVSGDLQWMRAGGLDCEIARHAAAGKKVLGICGGLQMLGTSLADPHGVDGAPGTVRGLGLLPLETRYAFPKRVLPVRARFCELHRPWLPLAGIEAPAYEIRTGVTRPGEDAAGAAPACAVALRDERAEPIGWQSGPVLGVYAHGLFEDAAVMRALFGAEVRTLDACLDGLAELVDAHMDRSALDRMLRP